MNIIVSVDGDVVAQVPLWMVKHAVEDAVSNFPGSKIVLEVDHV